MEDLEAANSYKTTNKEKVAEKQVHHAEKQLQSYNSSLLQCICCSATDHRLNQCSKFLAMDVNARNELVRRNKLFFNCMRKGHGTEDCKSKGSRKQCGRRHNSILHDEQRQQSLLLPTAMIPVKLPKNEFKYCRAMLDSGAQVSMYSISRTSQTTMHNRHEWHHFKNVEQIHSKPSHITGEQSIQC